MQAPRKINIPEHVVSISEDDFSIEEIPQATIDAACEYLREQGAVWGDVAFFESTIEYRNTGCFMYDGNTLVDLCSHPIDYGSVPPPFYPIENNLPINHWQHVVAHNGLIPVQLSTIRDNLTVPPQVDEEELGFFKFEYRGVTYTVVTELKRDPETTIERLNNLINDTTRSHVMLNWVNDLMPGEPNVLIYFHYV